MPPDDGFVSKDEVKGWTPAHGNFKIISVSHVWETREHPDPLGFQRDQVLKILDEKGRVCDFLFWSLLNLCEMAANETNFNEKVKAETFSAHFLQKGFPCFQRRTYFTYMTI